MEENKQNEEIYITKEDLVKAKEKFNKLHKAEECLTSAEYYVFYYMLKFIDLLIDGVK